MQDHQPSMLGSFNGVSSGRPVNGSKTYHRPGCAGCASTQIDVSKRGDAVRRRDGGALEVMDQSGELSVKRERIEKEP